jgi:hypothetical protein
MSTVARRFCSIPSRLSSATWKAISELICQNSSAAAAEFLKVSGIASSLVNDKLFAGNPMVVKNKGPRLRIYCIYDENAITGEDKNEEPLSWSPTAGEWQVFLPCTEEELSETTQALAAKSANFTVYNVKNGIPEEGEDGIGESANSLTGSIDWEAFKKL